MNEYEQIIYDLSVASPHESLIDLIVRARELIQRLGERPIVLRIYEVIV